MGHAPRLGCSLMLLVLASAAAHAGASDLKRALEQARAATQGGDADALDRSLRAALGEGGKPPVKGLLELALAFPAGKVPLHVLSHFGKQQRLTDEFTLQDLLVNFLLAAQERYRARTG